MTNWNEWFAKARTKQVYIDQMKDVYRLITDNFPDAETILDVGCGDQRMKYPLSTKKYVGIDRYIGSDPCDDLTWSSLQVFDVAFTSLFLLCLDPESMEAVFDNMTLHSKYIFLYEEVGNDVKQVADDKWWHDYTTLAPVLESGVSKLNPLWKWYIYEN